jgi:hypothetical protein
MNFTTQVDEAVQYGDAVPVWIGTSECILIRRDIFDRAVVRSHDDSEMTDNELQAIAARTLVDLDTAGPIRNRFHSEE